MYAEQSKSKQRAPPMQLVKLDDSDLLTVRDPTVSAASATAAAAPVTPERPSARRGSDPEQVRLLLFLLISACERLLKRKSQTMLKDMLQDVVCQLGLNFEQAGSMSCDMFANSVEREQR